MGLYGVFANVSYPIISRHISNAIHKDYKIWQWRFSEKFAYIFFFKLWKFTLIAAGTSLFCFSNSWKWRSNIKKRLSQLTQFFVWKFA